MPIICEGVACIAYVSDLVLRSKTPAGHRGGPFHVGFLHVLHSSCLEYNTMILAAGCPMLSPPSTPGDTKSRRQRAVK